MAVVIQSRQSFDCSQPGRPHFPAAVTGAPVQATGRPDRSHGPRRRSLGTIRDPSERRLSSRPPADPRRLRYRFLEASRRHVRPARPCASARPQRLAAPGQQLLRSRAVPARGRQRCSPAPRATSATSWPCRRSATSTPCRRRAKAARWCVPPRASSWSRTFAGIARRSCCAAAATPAATSSARCTAGPTT